MATSFLMPRPARRRARLLGVAVVSAGAWLGGELSYGLGINVDQGARREGPETFTPVVPASEVREGRLLGAEVDGTPIVLTQRGEAILAVVAVCPHLGGRLAEGSLDGDVVACPWHGSRCSMREGTVAGGPASTPPARLEARVGAREMAEVRAAPSR